MHYPDMAAVIATQKGATFAAFDEERFFREVVMPVKAFQHFLESTKRSCPIFLIFSAGVGEEYEEPRPSLREPYRTPGFVASCKHFPSTQLGQLTPEITGRSVFQRVSLLREVALRKDLEAFLRGQGANRPHVVLPNELVRLAHDLSHDPMPA